MMDFNVLLFDDFETLDAFGPVEVFGRLPEAYRVRCFSQNGGVVKSRQQVLIETMPLSEMDPSGILCIPGGMGTRSLVNDRDFIEQVKRAAESACYVLTVCTGSALLAKTGLLDGLSATSNKIAFTWATSNSAAVNWAHKARWVQDGKFYTSSGVSAGMDMALGFIADRHGLEKARSAAHGMEYRWNADREDDPFAAEGI